MNIRNIGSDIADAARDVGQTIEEKGSSGVSAASSGFEHLSDRLRTLASVVGSYASIRTLMHAAEGVVPGQRLLGYMGLQRRPSVLSRVATGTGFLIGGAVVGAGIALLVTPQTGSQLRSRIGRGWKALKHDTEEAATQAVETVKSTIGQVGQTVQGGQSGQAGQGSQTGQQQGSSQDSSFGSKSNVTRGETTKSNDLPRSSFDPMKSNH